MSRRTERFDLTKLSEEQDEAEVEVPHLNLVQRPPEPVIELEQGREAVRTSNGDGEALQKLAETCGRVDQKRATSLRLPPWLDDYLNQQVYSLKASGFRKISREAVIIQALVDYLGVTPPQV